MGRASCPNRSHRGRGAAESAFSLRLPERFTDAQFVELDAALAHESMRARMSHWLGYVSEGFNEGAACALPVTAAP